MVTYKGVPIRLSADFSEETFQARRDWQEIFKVMKSRDLQPRLLCPAKILFRIEGEIKKFLETKSSSSPNHYYMKYLRDLFKKMMNNRMAKKKKTPYSSINN